MKKHSKIWLQASSLFIAASMGSGIFSSWALAEENGKSIHKAKGQTIYAPIYSHIYSGNKQAPLYLAATLIIRNTDPNNSLTLKSADYFDSTGKMIRRYADKPIIIGPLASTRFFVSESDKEGGSGASFMVRWGSEKMISQPIVEAIMVSTQFQQGVSFTSRGEIIEETD